MNGLLWNFGRNGANMTQKIRNFFSIPFFGISILMKLLDVFFTNIGCIIIGISKEHYDKIK